ncbi:MBOAT family O-acyltransferase [Moorena producens]|uniref:MBOAT family O-acyltransferase n=1 Tax=Moorena producens TaxID=1155739 RepID=UPI003C732416
MYLITFLRKANEKEYIIKTIFIIGICANLLGISYYKYQGFFLENISTIFDLNLEIPKLVLPLAISFFTFQQIAYLVDVYKGRISGNHSFWKYCLFVTFFPQLIAGPIVRYQALMPQFSFQENLRLNSESLALGISIFSVGLFKKFLADAIAIHCDPVFMAAYNGEVLSFFEAWYGALAYTMQLYFDFSGYSDMAIGIGNMFGIRLPLNFFSPYKAASIIDFWRRWHMTLSKFLRDYLYIPLGGNRKGEFRRYMNILITMLLGGLWHGAGWTFVLWGGLHGLYLLINHCWQYLLVKLELTQLSNQIWMRLMGRIITFIAVVFAWVIFRSENLEVAVQMLNSMTRVSDISVWHLLNDTLQRAELNDSFQLGNYWQFLSPNALIRISGFNLLVMLLTIVWFFPNTQQLFDEYTPTVQTYDVQLEAEFENSPKYLQWKPRFTWLYIIIIMNLVSFSALASIPSEFLYFQF